MPYAFVFILAASTLAPSLMIFVLAFNIGAEFVLSVLHVFAARFSRFELRQKTATPKARISILVPAYNEPPAILMETLNALSLLDYEAYEVLVIDNNTEDPSVWKPVEAFVASLGNRFRFFHVDRLPGFKAGALNYVLDHIDSRSEYVAVIDADYVVEPEFVNAALSYFTEEGIALVQFPQQYRNCTKENQPIADEYRHFFKIYMNMANHLDCVPSTGTVSVYEASALKAIGGFRERALTEDADASLRLYEAGYRGVYVDDTIGYGLMPYDIEAYRKQKRRWAVGNTQSIKTLFSLYGKIPFWSWVGFLSHLTVWDHLNFLPFAVLAAYVFLLVSPLPVTLPHRQLFAVASISIFVTLAARLATFLVALRGQKHPVSRAFKAFIVHMGMTFLYSEAFGSLWFRTLSTFERTNKFILSKMPSLLKNGYKELLLGALLLVGAVESALSKDEFMITIAFAVSAASLFSILYVHWKILPTKTYSEKIISGLEEKYRSYLPQSP